MKKNPAIKSFMSATVVLVIMLVITGLLTYLIPNGTFNPTDLTFSENPTRGISFIAWIGSPILVLFSDSGTLVVAIIVFLLIIGGAINLLKASGLIESIILGIVNKFVDQPMRLMSLLVFAFMALGAFIGVFEEIVPLVPMVMLLSRRMGWDDLTGLSISVLATGLGFAAAVTNPFTIGVAQELAGVPIFSGALLRIFVFISVYGITVWYLKRHIARTQSTPEKHEIVKTFDIPQIAYTSFFVLMGIMFILVALTPFVEILRDLTLPLIGIVFLTAGITVGLITSKSGKWTAKQFFLGARDMAPAILLILLASGIKQVMLEGQILDTFLFFIAQRIGDISPILALYSVFFTVLILNFFIGSGSAKAFILMPILMPIMDLLGVSRQLGILAFQFGDGFSNVMYPTNAVLLIALGLAHVSYVKWLKFILPLQVLLVVLSFGWIAVAYLLGYGL